MNFDMFFLVATLSFKCAIDDSVTTVVNQVIKRSDVDLIFAAQKATGSKTITYPQFLTALDVVAATLFPTVGEHAFS